MAATRWPLFPTPSLYLARRALVEGRAAQPRLARRDDRHPGAPGVPAGHADRSPGPSPSSGSSRARRSSCVACGPATCRRDGVGDPSDRGAATMSPALQFGERVLLLDVKRRRYLVMLSRGRRVPLPRRLRAARRHRRRRRGRRRALDEGRRVHGAAPDARGLRRRDAAWRPGHLPEGPRARSACSPTSRPGGASSSPGSAPAPCR